MARNASGTYTLPASNPVAAGTVITTTWANPTLEDVADSLTASLDRNGQGGMLVGLKGFAGTNALPGFTFADELTSGLYRAGAADIRFSIGTLDATRWVDDSDTAPGSQQPFQIWDGAAWQDVFYADSPLFGTGVATALAIDIGDAGSVFLVNGALGTPSSGTLTNTTGLPPAGVVGTAAILGANTFTGLQTFKAGADIASATAIDLTAATGNTLVITGTTTTTSLTMTAGQQMLLLPSGAWPMTFDATTMNINGGASYTCAAGDRVFAVKDLAGVIRVSVIKQDGTAVVAAGGLTLGTPVVTTSGTSIDFTGIPAGTKRVTISLSEVSSNGTDNFILRIGDSGGVETTGYVGCGSGVYVSSNVSTDYTTAFLIGSTGVVSSGFKHNGTFTLTIIDASTNTWSCVGSAYLGSAQNLLTVGVKSLSAELDRIRLTTTGGTNTFDLGVANITYE